MDDKSGLPRHHTLPHGGSTHTHPSSTSSQSSQQMSPTPVMPVVPQPTPTALVSPTQLGHHPSLPSPSGPAPTNTYTGQVSSALRIFRNCLVLERSVRSQDSEVEILGFEPYCWLHSKGSFTSKCVFTLIGTGDR